MNRCYGCFESVADVNGNCPHCGFVMRNYKKPKWILTPGTMLNGKYLVGKSLGEGGFGITYLAWDVNMETKVAIKEYYPGYLVSRDVTSANGNQISTTAGDGNHDFQNGLKKYAKEAAVLSKFFELTGIVSVKDFFYENETAYIVMEFIDGISLKKVLDQNGGTVSAEEALRLIQPVISSLAVIHKDKLLHRDISPDNIMLDKNGRVKLIDFGAARYFDNDNEKSMTVMLKHGYAPIEQYSRNGEQSFTTDIYSLCAVLYRMITGRVPIESTDRIRNDELIPVRILAKKTPKYIADAIEKGLSIMPENRQQSMEELYNELYISKSGRVSRLTSRVFDKVYRFIQKLLIFIIICLIVVGGAGIIYRLNSDRIEAFKNKVQIVFADEEIVSSQTRENQNNNISSGENNEKIEKEETNTQTIESENLTEEIKTVGNEEDVEMIVEQKESSLANSEQSTVETSHEESASEKTMDPNVEHGIVVARDGYLNGKTQVMTVGNILDVYSDTTGRWDGYVDENNQTYIYYQGNKNGSSFAIEFQVYADDTFKVTGAAQNGEPIEAYSEFFQQILDEVGI